MLSVATQIKRQSERGNQAQKYCLTIGVLTNVRCDSQLYHVGTAHAKKCHDSPLHSTLQSAVAVVEENVIHVKIKEHTGTE